MAICGDVKEQSEKAAPTECWAPRRGHHGEGGRGLREKTRPADLEDTVSAATIRVLIRESYAAGSMIPRQKGGKKGARMGRLSAPGVAQRSPITRLTFRSEPIAPRL